ncbi:MAG: hypothetical protein AB1489_19100 [Acidobacteriota bacterium]
MQLPYQQNSGTVLGEDFKYMPTNPSDARIESVMEILVAQCSDLEALLALARNETLAVEKRDFEQLLAVVNQRATLGERLEVYHRQLAELRASLGTTIEPALSSNVAAQTAALVAEIKRQDDTTRPLLLAAHTEGLKETLRLDRTQRNLRAYSDHQASSIACDKRI